MLNQKLFVNIKVYDIIATMDKKLYLLDMDGTLYLGAKLFDFTVPFLNRIKASGARYVFITNNSSRGVETYIERMKNFGIDTVAEDFYTSTDAAIQLFKEKDKYKKIYGLGTKSFVKQLRDSGLNVVTEYADDIDCLLVGYDTELCYQKLIDASQLLINGVDYYATNPDWLCPTEFGGVPDCGSLCQMLSHVNDRMPEYIGKPKPMMVELCMSRFKASKEETVVIGDRIYTDIASGVNAGVETYFVLSGEGVVEDIEKYGIKPTYIVENVGKIL